MTFRPWSQLSEAERATVREQWPTLVWARFHWRAGWTSGWDFTEYRVSTSDEFRF